MERSRGSEIRVCVAGWECAEQLELAILADQHGWDGVFVWEAAYGVDAWTLLAAMAARTERVKLGTMLTPLPWRRPWKVASQVVTLDQLSNGRAILAVGLGAIDNFLGNTGEVLDRKTRAAMMDEGIDLIKGLWRASASIPGSITRWISRAGPTSPTSHSRFRPTSRSGSSARGRATNR